MYQFEADKFYPSPSNFFKMVRTIFGGIIFQDFAAPSFQNDAFDLQTGRSSLPVLCLFVCLFVCLFHLTRYSSLFVCLFVCLFHHTRYKKTK